MTHKYVYLFSEGDASMRNLLGGKGANLAEMTKLGLPVPHGRSTRISRHRSMPQSLKWRRSQARSSAINKIRCLSPYGPAPEPPCPA